VYAATREFPADERYGLTRQVRRSCASIPANIAEGCGRSTDADFARFCQMAMGSAAETEYHLLLAKDLGLLRHEAHAVLTDNVVEIKRMLTSLMKTLRTSGANCDSES
jgi:four helix bundle protein